MDQLVAALYAVLLLERLEYVGCVQVGLRKKEFSRPTPTATARTVVA